MTVRKIILFCIMSFGMVFLMSAQPAGVKIPADAEELNAVLQNVNSGSSLEKGINRYIMGYCFHNGVVVENDAEAALMWYIRSATYNYVPSWLAIAQIYEDMDNPFRYIWAYYEAALLGNDTGEKELEEIYSEDQDIIAGNYLAQLYRKRMDMAKFISVAYRNAGMGDIAVQADLGYYLMNGCGGDREKFIEGFDLYKKVADTDSVQVMHNLADRLGLSYNDDNFQRWYGRQAQETLVSVWSGLGMLYLTGTKYTQPDVQKAVKLLQKAAEREDTEAMKGLVKCYSEGLGVKKDPDKVKYWNDKIDEIDDYQYFIGF